MITPFSKSCRHHIWIKCLERYINRAQIILKNIYDIVILRSRDFENICNSFSARAVFIKFGQQDH